MEQLKFTEKNKYEKVLEFAECIERNNKSKKAELSKDQQQKAEEKEKEKEQAIGTEDVKEMIAAEDNEKIGEYIVSNLAQLIPTNTREREMGFNLGVVVLMSLFDEKSSGNWLRKVEQVIVDSEELVDGAEKAKQLNTLCGLLDVTSEQRLHVLKRVVQVCKHDGLGSVLEPAIPNQLSQVIRNVQPQTAQTTATAVILLTELADLYLADPEKQAVAFEVMKLRLTYFDDNADAAIDLIVRAINLPNYFAFDSLASIPAIHALPKSSPALAVLNLFIAGDYAAYSSSSLAALSPLINIQTAQTKLRLIAISVYGSEHIASSIPLASIASLIDVPSEQVELWIIDSIRLGLINAKIDQLSNSVVITKTSFASFGLPQWRLLSSLLSSWESSLSQLLPTITNAKLAAKLSASNEGAAVVEISSKK